MIICVASGKGGTGKTTISTNLAAALEEDISFLDCDVEEPNSHLFLQPEIDHTETVTGLIPNVDQGNCDGCKKCSDICRFGAVTLIGGNLLLFPELCHGCGGCIEICPQNVLVEGKKELGWIETGRWKHVTYYRGLLKLGEAMSPPVIKQLRKRQILTPHAIIDAPPGTSCPVVAAVNGVDFVLLVTEPTPFGLHDLILAHKTVQHLGIPCGLVVNRADLGSEDVERYAQTHNLPIFLKIPFSKEIATISSRGELLVHQQPYWRGVFQWLFTTIQDHLTTVSKDNERIRHH